MAASVSMYMTLFFLWRSLWRWWKDICLTMGSIFWIAGVFNLYSKMINTETSAYLCYFPEDILSILGCGNVSTESKFTNTD